MHVLLRRIIRLADHRFSGCRMRIAFLVVGIISFLLLGAPVRAQQDFSEIEIETIPVVHGIYMLTGVGGNIGLSVGEDGPLLVDDQYAPLSEKIATAVAELSDMPISFVVNTHWHWDHSGGNENMRARGAVIVAHENTRRRMSTTQFVEALDRRQSPSPAGALPVVTIEEGVSIHWNGDEIRVFHVAAGHTDGDVVVQFVGANVIHAGDNYFNGRYPLVDFSSGGTLEGMIATVDAILEIADETTKIIPGHGQLSNRVELQVYRDMLATVSERITRMIDEGMDRDAVISAKPTSDLDEVWGQGFLGPSMWVGIIYDTLSTVH